MSKEISLRLCHQNDSTPSSFHWWITAHTPNPRKQISLVQISCGFLGEWDQGLGNLENAVCIINKSFMTRDMEVGKFLKKVG